MLLSKVHVQLQVWRVEGLDGVFRIPMAVLVRPQSPFYEISSSSYGALFTRIPLLPSELDVLVIKPKGLLLDQQDTAFGCCPECQVKRARLWPALKHFAGFIPIIAEWG